MQQSSGKLIVICVVRDASKKNAALIWVFSKRGLPLAWTKNPKLGVDGSLMVANDVSIKKNVLPKFKFFKKEIG